MCVCGYVLLCLLCLSDITLLLRPAIFFVGSIYWGDYTVVYYLISFGRSEFNFVKGRVYIFN